MLRKYRKRVATKARWSRREARKKHVFSTYTYDAFGNLDDAIDPLSLETNYLYTGQQFDAIYTETYNLRARHYNPSNGGFLNRDTWAYNYQNHVELNRYVYTANNSATNIDPSGNNFIETGLNYVAQQIARNPVGFTIGAVTGYAVSGLLSTYTWNAMISGDCGDVPAWMHGQRNFAIYMTIQQTIGAILGGIVGALLPAISASLLVAQGGAGASLSFFDMIFNGVNPCNMNSMILSIMALVGVAAVLQISQYLVPRLV